MSPWEVRLFLSPSRWLEVPESKCWLLQRRQKRSLRLTPRGLASRLSGLTALRWSWQPHRCCPSSHSRNKRGYRKAGEGTGASADLAASTRKSEAYSQLLSPLPCGPLHLPEPSHEPAEDTRSREQRSGTGEASCHQGRTDRSHVVLHRPSPCGRFVRLPSRKA